MTEKRTNKNDYVYELIRILRKDNELDAMGEVFDRGHNI